VPEERSGRWPFPRLTIPGADIRTVLARARRARGARPERRTAHGASCGNARGVTVDGGPYRAARRNAGDV